MLLKDRVLKFCQLVKPLGIKWVCEARANSIEEDIVKKMKAAGCLFVRLGLETGSERMIKVMNKGHTLEQSRQAIITLSKVGMPIRAGFMIGMPMETLEDAKKTLKFMKEIYKISPSAHLYTYYYTPRPATPWYDLAIKQGMKDYTLKDWAKLDKFEHIYFNQSKMTGKQIKHMIFRTGICSLIYGKGMLKEYLLVKLNNIKKSLNKSSLIIRLLDVGGVHHFTKYL